MKVFIFLLSALFISCSNTQKISKEQQEIDKKLNHTITELISKKSYPDGHIGLSKPLPNAILRRQDALKTYDMNASIYIWKREVLLNNDTLFLPKTGLYVMDEDRSIDIDCELDFKFVEFIMKEKNAKR